MSDLAKLAGKSQKIKIGKHEIEMQPLSASDMDLMVELEEANKKEQAILIKKIIQKSIPNSSEEEVDNLSIEYIMDLEEAIMKMNKIDDKRLDRNKAFLDKIKEKQKVPQK